MTDDLQDTFCRDVSRSVGEPIQGTATESTWAFLAVEHPGPWEPKALTGLAPGLGEPLRSFEDTVEGSRVQLIRQGQGRQGGGLTLIAACTRPRATWIRRLHLESEDALAALDLPALFSGGEPTVGKRVDRPVLLVCTHGRRDRCCAKYGLEMYQALAELPGIEVWQTTHLGGHRFAATLLQLPDGLCYGRLGPDEAGALRDAVTAARLYRLDRFRGRTALSTTLQAAEHAVREQTAEADAAFGEALEERVRALTVQMVPTGLMRPKSCGKAPTEVTGLQILAR